MILFRIMPTLLLLTMVLLNNKYSQCPVRVWSILRVTQLFNYSEAFDTLVTPSEEPFILIVNVNNVQLKLFAF